VMLRFLFSSLLQGILEERSGPHYRDTAHFQRGKSRESESLHPGPGTLPRPLYNTGEDCL